MTSESTRDEWFHRWQDVHAEVKDLRAALGRVTAVHATYFDLDVEAHLGAIREQGAIWKFDREGLLHG